MFKKIGIAIGSLFITCGIVALAQTFAPNFPIVGGASYCGFFTNAVCTQLVPAGPAMTGLETVPLDTNAVQGQSPQSVKANLQVLNAGPYVYNAPLAGATITLTNTARRLVIDPAGTIATLTVVFPTAATLLDNQTLGLCSTQVVTALTITPGAGTSVLNTVTALAVPPATGAGTCYEWVYRQTNTSWYRVQ